MFFVLQVFIEAEEILISIEAEITIEEAIDKIIIVDELSDFFVQVKFELRHERGNNQIQIVLFELVYCENAELIFFHRKCQSGVFLLLLNPFHVFFVY